MEPAMAEMLRQSNYVSLAITSAVTYDYVLTFPSEVELIWNQRWTWVSFLYFLVRYLGLCCAVVIPFYGVTTFISPKTCMPFYSCFYAGWLQCTNRCYAMYTLNQFAFILFLAAGDMVMILRVWAMYNQSKLILGILLLVYIPEIVLSTVVTAIADTTENRVVVTVMNRSVCLENLPLYHWIENALIPIIPAAVTCVLVVIQFVRQGFQMYKFAKRRRLNRYMNLLCREGILYFFVTLFFGLVNLQDHTIPPTGGTWWYSMLSVASCVPVFTLTPRFILNMRALYARDMQNRNGNEIDTGFGLSSLSDPGVGGAAIVFADAGLDDGALRDEEMSIENGEEEFTGNRFEC